MSDSGSGGLTQGGAGAAPPASGGEGAGDVDVPLVPGEYWVRADPLTGTIHVRVLTPTAAIVGSSTFSIVRSTAALASETAPPMMLGGPPMVVRGPVTMRPSPPPTVGAGGIDTIALNLGNDGQLGDEAIVLGSRYVQAGCLASHNEWLVSNATVEPDTDETKVSVSGYSSTERGALPWDSFALQASKPVEGTLLDVVSASVAMGEQPVELSWFTDLGATGPAFAVGAFPKWSALVGTTVDFSGHVVNTNGAGPAGGTDWKAPLEFLDFGPSRSAPLDFGQATSPDVVTWGNAKVLTDDPACANDEAPNARSCLRMTGGAGMAARFHGSQVGVRLKYRLGPEPQTAIVRLTDPDILLLAADMPSPAISQGFEHAFGAPVDETFIVVRVPATTNRQTDPGCAEPFTGAFLLDSIEPVAP